MQFEIFNWTQFLFAKWTTSLLVCTFSHQGWNSHLLSMVLPGLQNRLAIHLPANIYCQSRQAVTLDIGISTKPMDHNVFIVWFQFWLQLRSLKCIVSFTNVYKTFVLTRRTLSRRAVVSPNLIFLRGAYRIRRLESFFASKYFLFFFQPENL